MSRKIMTVDDSPTVRQIVRFALRDTGHEIIEASNGMEALEMMKETRIDLLITDMNMPELDGIGLIRKVREKNRFIPIVILTTTSEKGKRLEAQAAGATAWINKPFSHSEFLAVINRVLGD